MEFEIQRHDLFRTAPGKSLEDCEPYQYLGVSLHDKETQEELGYICASYIKKEDWLKYEKDPFKYLRRFNGMYFYAESDENKWVPNPRKMLDFMYGNQLLDLSYEEHQDLQNAPIEELMNHVSEWRKIVSKEKKLKKTMRRFKEAVVDSPYIDYISVKPEHQNKGLGKRLYGEMAKWLQERGLSLHSSRVQSPEAERVWQSMVEKGWAVKQVLKHAEKPRNVRYQLTNHPLMVLEDLILVQKPEKKLTF